MSRIFKVVVIATTVGFLAADHSATCFGWKVLRAHEMQNVRGSTVLKAACNHVYEGPLCPVQSGCYDRSPDGQYKMTRDFFQPTYICSGTSGSCNYPNPNVKVAQCGYVAGKSVCVWHQSYDGDNDCLPVNREPQLDTYTCHNTCK